MVAGLSLVLLALAAACTPARAPQVSSPTASPDPRPAAQSVSGHSATPAAGTSGSVGADSAGRPASTAAPPPPAPTPIPCLPVRCAVDGHFVLGRPIGPPGRDVVDPTYRFGSTQDGAREPHHGVEFVNSSGTPVLAAADGVVVAAGDDKETVYADWPFFYGNLVVLRHETTLPVGLEGPLYTLYAHMLEVQVQVGDQVARGQQIGRVGLSGVATGSHLHFEVRLGDNSYESVQNPELWLEPIPDEAGQPYGTLAGRLEMAGGLPLQVPNLVVERLTGPGADPLWQLYLETYADPALAGDPVWGENFAVGDLPPGWYRLTFVARGLQVHEFEVFPGRLTLLTINVDEPAPEEE